MSWFPSSFSDTMLQVRVCTEISLVERIGARLNLLDFLMSCTERTIHQPIPRSVGVVFAQTHRIVRGLCAGKRAMPDEQSIRSNGNSC